MEENKINDTQEATDTQEIVEENAENKEQTQDIVDNDDQIDEVQKLKKDFEDMKDLAQRTQAEFMNYKKRVTKEKQDLTAFANEKIITELLTVLDNFERALNSEQDKENGLYKGVEMIKKQLEDILSKNGLEQINPIGEEFDPNCHHAVMQEKSDESNKVLEVLQKGYKLKERVIRPAMVKVSE